MPNLYSSTMVHLSRADVVRSRAAPACGALLTRLTQTAGLSGCTEAESAATGPILSQVVASGNAIGLNWFPIGHSAPVAEHRLDQRQRRDRGRIGAQNARPERKPHDVRQLEQRGPFVVGEASFGTDQHAHRQLSRKAAAAPRRERRDGILHVCLLVAE